MPEHHVMIQELAEEFGWTVRQLFPEYKRLKFQVHHGLMDKGYSLGSEILESRDHVFPVVQRIDQLGLMPIYLSFLIRNRAPTKDDGPFTDNELAYIATAEPRYILEAAYRAVRLRGRVNKPSTVIHG